MFENFGSFTYTRPTHYYRSRANTHLSVFGFLKQPVRTSEKVLYRSFAKAGTLGRLQASDLHTGAEIATNPAAPSDRSQLHLKHCQRSTRLPITSHACPAEMQSCCLALRKHLISPQCQTCGDRVARLASSSSQALGPSAVRICQASRASTCAAGSQWKQGPHFCRTICFAAGQRRYADRRWLSSANTPESGEPSTSREQRRTSPPSTSSSLRQTLVFRGLLKDVTSSNIWQHLDNPEQNRRTLYCGIDPTAASLHLGNLLPLLALWHVRRVGHRAIVVVSR